MKNKELYTLKSEGSVLRGPSSKTQHHQMNGVKLKNKKVYSISITPELMEKFKVLAKSQKTTVSKLVQGLVSDYVKNNTLSQNVVN